MHHVALFLVLAASLPREWRAFKLGMSKQEFVSEAERLRTTGREIGHCSVLDPAHVPASTADLVPHYTHNGNLTIDYYTPRAREIERCEYHQPGGLALRGVFLDGALVNLSVDLSLRAEDVNFLAQTKYGAPELTSGSLSWREPSEMGWQTQNEHYDVSYWHDEGTVITLIPFRGTLELTLTDERALRKHEAIPLDKLPDPLAAHRAELLRTEGF